MYSDPIYPLRLAVLARANDAELFKEVSYINSNQDYYQLTLLPGIEPTSIVEKASSEYDAVLVLDREMMVGGSPKYNRYLFTYRDNNLSDETMIVDSRFDSKNRIGFTFLQVAATSTRAQSLLMEIGLMALAANLRLDDDLLSYYRKVDRISIYEDDQISQAAVQDILKAREQIIVACFLRGN